MKKVTLRVEERREEQIVRIAPTLTMQAEVVIHEVDVTGIVHRLEVLERMVDELYKPKEDS